MISLQAILTLNNRAVELFHSNCIPEAAITYYQSIRMIIKEIGSSSPHVIIENDATSSNDTLPHPQQDRFHSSTIPSSSSTSICMQENKLFVYQRTLFLQESSSSHQNDLQAMSIYCAGILFNAAILHHQDSIKTGNSVTMEEAYRLYTSSLQLLIALPYSENNDTVALLEIANINNLAQIELEKGLVMEAGKRLRVLTHVLQTLQSNTIHRLFTADEIEGILTNALMGNGMVSSPAA